MYGDWFEETAIGNVRADMFRNDIRGRYFGESVVIFSRLNDRLCTIVVVVVCGKVRLKHHGACTLYNLHLCAIGDRTVNVLILHRPSTTVTTRMKEKKKNNLE